jgi:hypothetical protein
MTSPVAFAPQIAAAAQRYHLDPNLLAAVAAQETGGPGATSGANVVGDGGHGHGVFQIDDRYHAFATTPAAMDPGRNADYAAGLLAGLLQKYGGNVHAALSAYNAGSPTATGTTTDWGNGVNVGYADSVMLHYAQLGGNPAALGAAGAGAGSAAVAARDAEIPELADTTASVNQLQSLAAASSAAPIGAAIPVASLPPPPPTQAQQAQAQAPLTQDYYANADGDGDAGPADPSQAVRSS